LSGVIGNVYISFNKKYNNSNPSDRVLQSENTSRGEAEKTKCVGDFVKIQG
jgi:hypothetical protein